MLDMKQHCEQCNADVAIDGEAFICSYECTFCFVCTTQMKHVCPNCGGELVKRPTRNVVVVEAEAG